MTGTIVNAVGIVLGAIIGSWLKKGIPLRIHNAVLKVQGLAIGIIGLNGVMVAMLSVNAQTGRLSDSGSLLLLISLVLGCLIGEWAQIDARLAAFGQWLEEKLRADGIAQGFITASLVFCIGAMSIIGPLNDGLTGDSSILFIKSLLDFTTSIVLASALGFGVALSAVPVFLSQGAIALLASFLAPIISDDLIRLICMVGYSLVLCIALNFLLDTRIKVANLLPALVFPVLYYLIWF